MRSQRATADDRDQRGEREQHGPHDRDGRPRSKEAGRAGEREDERAQERPRERDPVPVRLERGVSTSASFEL